MSAPTHPWLRAELISNPGAQLMIPADGVEFHDDQLVFHHQGEVVYVAEQGQLRSITWFAKQPNPETARRKALWPNHGTRWTEDQRTDLRHRLQAGQGWKAISTAAGRSRTGCQQEAVKQGWLHPETLQPLPALLSETPAPEAPAAATEPHHSTATASTAENSATAPASHSTPVASDNPLSTTNAQDSATIASPAGPAPQSEPAASDNPPAAPPPHFAPADSPAHLAVAAPTTDPGSVRIAPPPRTVTDSEFLLTAHAWPAVATRPTAEDLLTTGLYARRLAEPDPPPPPSPDPDTPPAQRRVPRPRSEPDPSPGNDSAPSTLAHATLSAYKEGRAAEPS